MNKLSMSLDEVIAQKEKAQRSSKPARGGGRGSRAQPSVGPAKGNQNRKRNLRPEPYGRNEHDDRGKPSRNLGRGISSETIVQPFHVAQNPVRHQPAVAPKAHHELQQTSRSSVFSRLGKGGTRVLFKNLRDSVEANDVRELCGTVGDVGDVSLQKEGNGRRSATVVFPKHNDAVTCATKFNGE